MVSQFPGRCFNGLVCRFKKEYQRETKGESGTPRKRTKTSVHFNTSKMEDADAWIFPTGDGDGDGDGGLS